MIRSVPLALLLAVGSACVGPGPAPGSPTDDLADAAAPSADAGDVVDTDESDAAVPEVLVAQRTLYRLPYPLAGSSAVAVGRSIYVFGGDSDTRTSDAIIEIDTASGDVAELPARLPAPSKITSAVHDGRYAWVFGGLWNDALSDRIVRFDPESGAVDEVEARLPSPRGRTAAFFDGQSAFVLGGNLGGFAPTGYLDEIVRFDPSTGTAELTADRIPEAAASRIGAIWDGQGATLVGGMIARGKTDRIVTFTPGRRPATARARLPAPWDGGALALLGGEVWILGGMSTTEFVLDTVWVYDPAAETLRDAGIQLPSPRKGTAAATVADTIYLIGGRTETGLLDEIVAIGWSAADPPAAPR